ncbi:MAG: methionyl-tRNA formyltransferase [Candidatus Wolfebacteria bacterium]|nr:methionyl-tRNA formyltransferase [Candidatus Wolfebacteria bacterium]
MKYVFFGTPEFAAIILDKLVQTGFIPDAIVCNPDRPAGRKQIMTPPPTKILAGIRGFQDKVNMLQPEKLDQKFISSLSKIHDSFDFFIVAAYGKIIPKEVFGIPDLGTIGVHPSLLPGHRGASPIQAIILSGNTKTGTTLYLMDEKVDHGPIIAQKALENYESGIMNYESLMKKLAELSGDLLIKILPEFLAGKIKAETQDEALATFTKKFVAEDGFVKSEDLETAQNQGGEIALEIDRKIRALNPEPGTWTIKDGKRMKLLEAEITSENKLKLKKIQIEGGNPVSV